MVRDSGCRVVGSDGDSAALLFRDVNAFVLDAVRTPIGQRYGVLGTWHAVDLLAWTFARLVERPGVSPEAVELVIAGCESLVGEQAINVARNAVLSAGWSESIAAYSVDGASASSAGALQSAIAHVAAGVCDVVVVGGVESASRVPQGATTGVAVGKPFGPGVHERFAEMGGLIPPGVVAENIAHRYGFSREVLDAYVDLSHERASKAATSTRSDNVIVVPQRNQKHIFTGIDLDADELSAVDPHALEPAFVPDGVTTAANFALPADGAAAALIVNDAFLQRSGLVPVARIEAVKSRGGSVLDGDSGYAVACEALDSCNRELASLARVDVVESSAATALAFLADSGLSDARVNVDGGALATGLPAGAAMLIAVCDAVAALRVSHGDALAVLPGADSMTAAVVLSSAAG